jgi:hypothetical protein
MAKLRTELEQQAYERRMRLLYEQLRNEGDLLRRECDGVSRESAKSQRYPRRAVQSYLNSIQLFTKSPVH